MSTMLDLCLSGARDKFGHLFRDWHVVGWEQGKVSPDYVCQLYCAWEPKPAATPTSDQLALF